MVITELAAELNSRFAKITASGSGDHLGWDWDGWARELRLTVPGLVEKLLYTIQFKRDRFAYRLFEVLASRPGQATHDFLVETVRTYRWEPERAMAARLLGELKDRDAGPVLVARLTDAWVFKKDQLKSGSGLYLSEWAEVIEALGEIGEPTATFILGKLAEEPRADAGIRTRAVDALRKIEPV